MIAVSKESDSKKNRKRGDDSLDDDLLRAARDDKDNLKFACDQFTDHIKTLVGTHYSKNGSENPVPNNKFAVLLNTLMPLLAGQNPRVCVTTKKPGLRPVSLSFETAFPQRLDQMNYADATRRQTASAIFAPFGVSKIGRQYLRTEEIDGEDVKITEPYDREVLLEDFVYDTKAKHWRDVQYAADRCDVDFDDFMEAYGDEMDEDVRDRLERQADDNDSDRDDESGNLVSEISTSNSKHRGQYRKTLSVWQFWCRGSDKIKVFDSLKDGTKLIEYEYRGPQDGPYHLLSFTDVPGQIMGLSPAMIICDIVNALNLSLNKAIKQSEIQKTNYGFRDATVATTVRTLPDGHTFHSTTPDVFTPVRIGGADQANLGMAFTAGNILDQMFPLSLLGGSGASTGTATQESILQGNAGRGIAHMAYRVYEFQRSKIRHIAEDMWDDQIFDPDITYTPPGSRLVFTLSFAPERRWGEFPEYDIDVIPFSMSVKSPPERWNEIIGFVQGVIMPASQMMAQQGDFVNWRELVSGFARSHGLENEFSAFMIRGDRTRGNDAEPIRPPAGGRNGSIDRSSQGRPQAQDMATKMLLGAGNPSPVGNNGASY